MLTDYNLRSARRVPGDTFQDGVKRTTGTAAGYRSFPWGAGGYDVDEAIIGFDPSGAYRVTADV